MVLLGQIVGLLLLLWLARWLPLLRLVLVVLVIVWLVGLL